MKPEYLDLPVIKDEEANEYQMQVGDDRAIIVFRETPLQIALLHTEVDPPLEGKGAGSAIIEKVLTLIEESGKSLIPLCPFVLAYIKRNPAWWRIVDERYKDVAQG